MTSNNNNTKTSKHRCRVFIKKKFLNEFKLTVWNMLNTYSWIIFDVVWTKIIRCQITCSRPYEFNFHFFGNIYFNYHPMFGNSKNSSLPTQPLTVSKKWKKVQKNFHLGCQVSKATNISFQNPWLDFFWDFIPFVHSHLLLLGE